eukprot:10139183-Alexandrium_andersonii.AAC.1
MSASLVGSEMCIRDRFCAPHSVCTARHYVAVGSPPLAWLTSRMQTRGTCLLYTSDAADDM